MDFTLLEPRQLKRDSEGSLLVACKCSVCKHCWLNVMTEKCIYGGPFAGYVKIEEEKK